MLFFKVWFFNDVFYIIIPLFKIGEENCYMCSCVYCFVNFSDEKTGNKKTVKIMEVEFFIKWKCFIKN